MKLGIVGSREFTNENKVRVLLECYIKQFGVDNLVVVSGGCPNGADFVAKKVTLEMGLNYVEFPPVHFHHNEHCVNPPECYRRDYNQIDWRHTLEILKSKNMIGVVLNNGNEYIPLERELINLNNKTTIKEAVEIVKSASGYIGIDSAFSVIAAKTMEKDNMFIKSLNDHCYQWAHIYYKPHKTFEFIKKSIK